MINYEIGASARQVGSLAVSRIRNDRFELF